MFTSESPATVVIDSEEAVVGLATTEALREEAGLRDGRSIHEPRLEMGEEGDAGACLATTDIPYGQRGARRQEWM